MDLIDRQAAIDEINERQRKLIYCFGFENDMVKIMNIAKRIITAIPPIQSEPKWIPVSERLPEEYGNYLITTHDGNVDIGTIDPKKKGVWSACDSDGFYWLREVIAWMPLPEPYREEGEQNAD